MGRQTCPQTCPQRGDLGSLRGQAWLGGLNRDLELEDFAVIHRAVAVVHFVESSGLVEDPAVAQSGLLASSVAAPRCRRVRGRCLDGSVLVCVPCRLRVAGDVPF
jgi:hypothetical protein